MKLARAFRRMSPLIISFGLIGFLMWWVSPRALFAAAAQLDWRLLGPATAVMVLALYLWDAACLPLVYQIGGGRVRYLQSLHLRGLSYLGGAINYELGQAALAWCMARLQNTGLMRMLLRSVLLAYHDILVLLSAGLLGSLLTEDPRVERIRPYIGAGLAVALGVGLLFRVLPHRWITKFEGIGIRNFLEDWSVSRSVRLMPMRVVYFGILVVYAAVALAICRLPVDHEVVLSTVPLVLLADGLPSLCGLGTRETALQLLLTPDEPAVLLAMSLFWSTGMIVGRALIGLGHYWAQQLWGGSSMSVSEAIRNPWHQPVSKEESS